MARAVATETQHRIVVEGRELVLCLRRSARRRSFALQVDHRGPRVAVPLGASLRQIDRFIHEHGHWLLDRIEARAQLLVRQSAFVLENGAIFPLRGQAARLRVAHSSPSTRVRAVQWCVAADGVEELWLSAAKFNARGFIHALQARALAWYRDRVDEFCARLGLASPVVRLSNARTRWGSCSRTSGIRLHWRLIHLAPALIDYVVAHEVAHLVEMNHSPRFWAVVESLYPDWRSARIQLRQAAAGLPVIDESDLPSTLRED